jgi:hypothetical protein
VLLQQSAERLGPPKETDDLGDPAFMAVHALNRIDPKNYPETVVNGSDGAPLTVYKYESPTAEHLHLEALREAAQEGQTNISMQGALSVALENRERSSPEFAATAVEWAIKERSSNKELDKDASWMREQAMLAAAVILVRDADAKLREKHMPWAREEFARALRTEEDPVHRVRAGILYNPFATAFVGLSHALSVSAPSVELKGLLDIAASENPAAGHGFRAVAKILAELDERLPRSLLRCAFAACMRPRRQWDMAEKEKVQRALETQKRSEAVVAAELDWLAGKRAEPSWPSFPARVPTRRRGIRLSGGTDSKPAKEEKPKPPDFVTDHQAAALWLGGSKSIANAKNLPWLRELVRVYSEWTAVANGADLEDDDDVADATREWSDVYFDLLARCLPGLSLAEVGAIALTPITALPDSSLLEVVEQFLRSVDEVYFNAETLDEGTAVGIRAALAARVMTTGGWRRLGGNRSSSIERKLGPAIATLFMNSYGMIQPPTCYLYAKGLAKTDSCLPTLETLAVNGASLFVAIVTLNLVEVAPRPAHLAFVVTAARAWLRIFPDFGEFWLDHSIGQRVCACIEAIWRQEPKILGLDKPLHVDVEQLLAALISMGIPEAKRLEEDLGRTQS